MEAKVELYKTTDNQTELNVQFENETVWLNRTQMAELFDRDIKTLGKHINNIFQEGELNSESTVAKFATVQNEGNRNVERQIEYYNLDVIISVGYRVKSKRGTQFRQWATQRMKDYLVQGYAINEKRLAQKQQEVEYLKAGIRILNRAITEQSDPEEFEMLRIFAKGLKLLDDYDHEQLDSKGKTRTETFFPSFEDYMALIQTMYSDFESDVFAKPKDDSFHSSINQIKQSFGDLELYPTLEEKAANLLYFITKNHSFVDGNKRIAAACFLYFMQMNNALIMLDGLAIVDNSTLAALTLFIATSKTEEAEVVKQFIISVLNRNNYLSIE